MAEEKNNKSYDDDGDDVGSNDYGNYSVTKIRAIKFLHKKQKIDCPSYLMKTMKMTTKANPKQTMTVAHGLVVYTVVAAAEMTTYCPPFLWKKMNP